MDRPHSVSPLDVQRAIALRQLAQARERAGAQDLMLPREALIQRGGICLPSDVTRGAIQTMATWGCWGMSAHAADVRTKLDLLRQTPMLPNPRLRYTTVGALRDAGFPLDRTGDAPHITIWFPSTRPLEDWLRLVDEVFEAPVLRADVEAGYA